MSRQPCPRHKVRALVGGAQGAPSHLAPVVLSFTTGPLHLVLTHRGDELLADVTHDDEPELLFRLSLDGESGIVQAINAVTDETEDVYP